MEIQPKKNIVYIVAGKARHGKDTTADIIKKIYEEKMKKVILLAYGDTIKQYAKKVSSWDGSEETKPRTIMQQIGTDIIRKNIDEFFFINRMIDDIKVYSYFFDVIVITDARFANEIDDIKNKFSNSFSINIFRPNFDSGLTKEQLSHPSETALDNYNAYDYKIINDKSIEDLEIKIRKIIGD